MSRPRTRTENKDPCSICGKIVKYKSDVARHYLQHAPNVEDLKTRCPWPNCTYKTLQKSNVSTHMIRAHGRKKIYFCSDCTFSALDQQTADRHKRVHITGDDTISPVVPEPPRLDPIQDVAEARIPSAAVEDQGLTFDPNYQHITQDGFINADQDLAGIMQFATMPPSIANTDPVSTPSCQLSLQESYQPLSEETYQALSWEDYYKCFAEMSSNGTVPSNAPNPQLDSAVYLYGRQYAPRNNLASCSVPVWVQPSNNPTPCNTCYQYHQHQAAPHQPSTLPESSWDGFSSSSSLTSSRTSSIGDYPPDYGVPLQTFPSTFGADNGASSSFPQPTYGAPLKPLPSSLGDLPPTYGVPHQLLPSFGSDLQPNYGAPLETFPPSSHTSGLDSNLNFTAQTAPAYQYDGPWDLGYYGNEMIGASNLDAVSAQSFQLGMF